MRIRAAAATQRSAEHALLDTRYALSHGRRRGELEGSFGVTEPHRGRSEEVEQGNAPDVHKVKANCGYGGGRERGEEKAVALAPDGASDFCQDGGHPRHTQEERLSARDESRGGGCATTHRSSRPHRGSSAAASSLRRSEAYFPVVSSRRQQRPHVSASAKPRA